MRIIRKQEIANAELQNRIGELESRVNDSGKNIITMPNGDKYEVVIGEDGSIATKIAESERGMLL